MAVLSARITPHLSPPKVCLTYNMWLASSRVGSVLGPSDYLWFYDQVKSTGPWNYKKSVSKDFEDFGNFNYGATGTAMGVPENVLLRAAGWAQSRAGTSAQAFREWYTGAPYGDDPKDQFQIKRGIQYAKQNGYPRR
mgnify:CR=1 FL=1